MSKFYIVRNRKTGSISGHFCDLFVSGEHERLASLHVHFDLLGVARAIVEHVAHGQQPLHVAERGQGKLHGERNVLHGHRRQREQARHGRVLWSVRRVGRLPGRTEGYDKLFLS